MKKHGMFVLSLGFITVLVMAACGGGSDKVTHKEVREAVPDGKRLVEFGGEHGLIGFPEDFLVPPNAQVQIASAENIVDLPYGNPATAYLSVPDADVAKVLKFFKQTLPKQGYATEPCNEAVRNGQGIYSQQIVFFSSDPNPPPEEAAMGFVQVIRGDQGNAIAIVEFNKPADPDDYECIAALDRIGERLAPNAPEEREHSGPPNT
jgi:hypothetical protein